MIVDFAGAYDDEDAAARAYDLAALKYWGSETLLNFPVNLLIFHSSILQTNFRCLSIYVYIYIYIHVGIEL